MELKDVTKITDIQTGDTVIVTGDMLVNTAIKVEHIKVSGDDGTEIILNKRKNQFFNLGMYLEGKSWVKECKILV